jgi:plastocyanin
VKRGGIAAAAALAVLAYPSAAAADVIVHAVDDPGDGGGNRWAPNIVEAKVGEPVTWTFAGTKIPHNVASASSNWSFSSELGVAKPDVSRTFDVAGTYKFICDFHKDTMTGEVRVTDAAGGPAPPPPPPPLSEQPFPNDFPAPATFEALDETAPTLSSVRVSRAARGARVRFRLSEAARVTIQLKRGRRVVRTRRANGRRGANSVLVRGVRGGRYRVQISARDLSGNPARSRRAQVTVRS